MYFTIASEISGPWFRPFLLGLAIVVIGLFVFWVRMLIHAAKSDSPNKLAWVVIILLLPSFIGAFVYYLAVYLPVKHPEITKPIASSKKTRSRGLLIFAIILILGCIGLFILDISTVRNGYSIDPTDPYNYFTVTIQNDLPQPVRVDWVNKCVWLDKEKCNHGWDINPGDVIHGKESRGGGLKYRVATKTKQQIGCLNISPNQSKTHGEIIVQTSQVTNCQ